MKSRIGLILAAVALVLTLLLTMGKVIESGVVFRRIIINSIVFYLIGLGLELFYKKYLLGIIKEPEGQPSRADMSESELDSIINDPASQGVSKGSTLDLQVGGGDDLESEIGFAPLADLPEPEQIPAKNIEEQPSKPDAVADRVPGKKSAVPFQNKFEIRDDFIFINDKKIPNDAKMMAEAIKTKLAE